MKNEQQEQIFNKLGEISGELRGILRHQAAMAESQKTTQSLVQGISAEVSAIRAVQHEHGKQLTSMDTRMDKLETRINKQEITVAKHASGFGALAAFGTALAIEAVKQWWLTR
ncbi:MAG: hypothetical protein LBI35_01210 [Burkholderiales bacterium]|jgi:DNA-binding FrmR family transcriptional regulator|nr:hypothetical protein [Burkholderiales bacterium]